MGLKVLAYSPLGSYEVEVPNLTMDEVIAAVEADDYIGFCIYCGHETSGVEPDARYYKCDNCEKEGVFGAEELLVMAGI